MLRIAGLELIPSRHFVFTRNSSRKNTNRTELSRATQTQTTNQRSNPLCRFFSSLKSLFSNFINWNPQTTVSNPFEKDLFDFKNLLEEMQALKSMEALLDWDLQTNMPEKASDFRAWQIGFLRKQYHEKLISEKMAKLLTPLREESIFNKLNHFDQTLVKETGKEYDRFKNIPLSLIEEFAETTAKAHHIWVNARATNQFDKFAPTLEKIFSLRRQMAELMGYVGSPYNALLDLYEPEMTTNKLDNLFKNLKGKSLPIIEAINNSPTKLDNSCLNKDFTEAELNEISLEVLQLIGFDLSRGHLSKSAHPFSTIVGENDVRLTTRYKNFWDSLTTTLHEGGHGLYDQGVDSSLAKTPLFEGTSLGIHESQSRLYEYTLGTGLPFWKYYFPILQRKHPDRLKDITLEDFYKAINRVQPVVIRNEPCDEITYNLHVILRYEIEKDVIEGRLQVKDIPKVWNEKMQKYLGITPKNDSEGCLQDVHWACGDIGYFPSYTLGNLYAAQFYNTMKKEMPNLEEQIAKGDLLSLREWLRNKIHKYGKAQTPSEILERVTGEALNINHFINYIKEKYGNLYGIKNWESKAA